MPKRKRSAYEDDGVRILNARKKDVQECLAKGRKQLHRALKTAKGFERQKLGKRLKNATTNGQNEDVVRINREIEALKGLDLDKTTNAHLHKSLLKTKVFAENESLPGEVRVEVPKPEGDEESLKALNNVLSGMYKMKQVQGVMSQVINSMFIALGIPPPSNKGKVPKTVEVKGILKNGGTDKSNKAGDLDEEGHVKMDKEELPFEGFDSEGEGEEEEEDIKYESLDEEGLAQFDALLGAPSDEESFDEGKYARNRLAQPSTHLSLSLSPAPSDSPRHSVSLSPEPETAKAPKALKAKAAPPAKPALSTFLPTLMGGYWSGSESSASDIEDAAPIRKNRPGQMARRAIWEKKYGQKANHIKTGQGLVGKGKDDGWDAKWGATDTDGRGGRRSGRGASSHSGRQRNYANVTGENAIAVEPKKRGMGRKDDVGVLHPSWQAAKKAKEEKKMAKFQGKKVTFD